MSAWSLVLVRAKKWSDSGFILKVLTSHIKYKKVQRAKDISKVSYLYSEKKELPLGTIRNLEG
jgi:hypothetical protein